MGVPKGWEAGAIRGKLCNNDKILQSKNGLKEEAKEKGVGTGNAMQGTGGGGFWPLYPRPQLQYYTVYNATTLVKTLGTKTQ